ncbi:hypothetical protein SEA_BUMBLE_40 [Arthrobacter phage Bumble]|uniref:Uncharacterized protein n=1 Tax=Arthrobacter phage Bumble TaxID=2743904 RepID=A0A7G3VAB0_9CAUD|nr:hypothetical protein SEA_BUMBLE_40 [Arthrobacter phage Bumble]
MIEADVKKLLLFIQSGDGRQLSEADLAYWTNELPARLELDDALEAVRDFRARVEPEYSKYRWLDITVLRIYVKRLMERRKAAALKAEAQKALPGPPHRAVTARGLRQRDPEEWDRLVNAGRAEGNADRAYTQARNRGLPDAEARAAGQAEYEATLARIEAEKNSSESPKGTTTDPARPDFNNLGETA